MRVKFAVKILRDRRTTATVYCPWFKQIFSLGKFSHTKDLTGVAFSTSLCSIQKGFNRISFTRYNNSNVASLDLYVCGRFPICQPNPCGLFLSFLNHFQSSIIETQPRILWSGRDHESLVAAGKNWEDQAIGGKKQGERTEEEPRTNKAGLMEWDYKIPSWDPAELEQNAESNPGGIVEPLCSHGGQTNGVNCSVDLKLGGSGNPEPPEKWKDQRKMMMMAVSSSSPLKRARAPSTAGQNVSCSVDGCKSDLSHCREYHRRHKVCEPHSKTPIVMVGGVEQRFCQQCSRFHLLAEFDEVKRSCRKRLDGHNRRRRKPQAESIGSTSLFPVPQDTGFSTYAPMSQTHSSNPNWSAVVKTEENAVHFNNSQQRIAGSFSRNFAEGKQFAFFQEEKVSLDRTATEPSIRQPLLKIVCSAESGGGGSSSSSNIKMFSGGLKQALDSDCALSLLSSPTQTSSVHVGQMLPANRVPMSMCHPLVPSFPYGGREQFAGSQALRGVLPPASSCSGIKDEQAAGGVAVSDADGLPFQGMFHIGGEDSPDGVLESLPFSWQ